MICRLIQIAFFGILVAALIAWGTPFFVSCSASDHASQNTQNEAQQPKADEQMSKPQAILCAGNLTIVRLERTLADTQADAATWFTALATIVIAAFTVVLACVTGSQVQLARSEFIASHRPQIIIRSFERFLEGVPEEKIGVQITYINAGESDAIITGIKAKIHYAKLPLRPGMHMVDIPIPKKPLAPGDDDYFAVHSDALLHEMEKAATDLSMALQQGAGMFCVGAISYRDKFGRKRRTGFCRHLQPPGERWVHFPNTPEYEYSY